MSGSTPRTGDPKTKAAATVLSVRLNQCWKADMNWQLIPAQLKGVSNIKCYNLLSCIHRQSSLLREWLYGIGNNYWSTGHIVYPTEPFDIASMLKDSCRVE